MTKKEFLNLRFGQYVVVKQDGSNLQGKRFRVLDLDKISGTVCLRKNIDHEINYHYELLESSNKVDLFSWLKND